MSRIKAGRVWSSKLDRLWLPPELIRERARDVADGATSMNAPRCMRCTRENKRRTSVASWSVKDSGKHMGGDVYTDIRVACHGEERVVRFNGLDWKRHGGSESLAMKLAAFPFFRSADETEVDFRPMAAFDVDAYMAGLQELEAERGRG